MSAVRRDGITTVILALLTTLFFSATVQAEQPNDWELALEEKGISIHTRDVDGSAFKAYKGVTVIDAPLASVLGIFSNPRANREWLEGCVSFEEIARSSFYSYSVYQVWDLPWPATDRDFVVDVNIERVKDGVFNIQMDDRAGMKPEHPDRVRASMPSGYYRLTEVAPGKTEVIMSQHVEPNGSLPGWMVNSLVTETPYESLRNLRDLATGQKYADATFIEKDNGRIAGVRLP